MKIIIGIAFIFFLPIILLVLFFVGTEINKAYWDWQVSKLCMEEGGVTIYETVELTEQEFQSLGGEKGKPLLVPFVDSSESRKNPEFPYEREWLTTDIKKDNPNIWRSEFYIYRKSDKKVLGEYITYSRRGGDFPTIIGHPSSFGCRDVEGFDRGLAEQLFIVEEE